MRRLPALLLCLPLVLAGCGGGSDGASPNARSSDGTASPGGDQSVAVNEAYDGPLPSVEGDVGEKPTVKAPGGTAPKSLQTKVLVEGDGATVQKGDLLVSHYLGQTWRDNKVFDNSYDRGEPAGFAIGTGGVIKGWDDGLVGQKVGSRVLLVIPPDLGYGPNGNPQGGIKGDDTLVFVVDVMNRFGKDSGASGEPQDDLPADLPKVQSVPGKKPTIDVKGTEPPKQQRSAVLIEGTGDPIDAGKNLVLQAVQVDYETGKQTYSSWELAPVTVKADRVPGLADAVKGQKVGSRILLTLPASPGQGDQPGHGPAAVVFDVVGMF